LNRRFVVRQLNCVCGSEGAAATNRTMCSIGSALMAIAELKQNMLFGNLQALGMVDVTEISAVIAAIGVLVGVVYYILDMRHQTRMRDTDFIMKLYSQFNSLEFQKMWSEVLRRDAKDLDDYHKKYGMAEFGAVGLFFEGIGILLERKLIDMELVDDMFSTAIKWSWEKMRDMVFEFRKVRNRPEILEWFEYLYNEMQKREQQS